MDNEFIYTILL